MFLRIYFDSKNNGFAKCMGFMSQIWPTYTMIVRCFSHIWIYSGTKVLWLPANTARLESATQTYPRSQRFYLDIQSNLPFLLSPVVMWHIGCTIIQLNKLFQAPYVDLFLFILFFISVNSMNKTWHWLLFCSEEAFLCLSCGCKQHPDTSVALRCRHSSFCCFLSSAQLLILLLHPLSVGTVSRAAG